MELKLLLDDAQPSESQPQSSVDGVDVTFSGAGVGMRPPKRQRFNPDLRPGPSSLDEILAWPQDLWQQLDSSCKRLFLDKAAARQKLILTSSYSGVGSAEQALQMFFQAWVSGCHWQGLGGASPQSRGSGKKLVANFVRTP